MGEPRYGRLPLDEASDAAAVVAARRREPVDERRREPRERAAHAVADGADLELLRLERPHRGPKVGDHLLPADLAPEGPPALDVARPVAHGDVALDTVEERRRQREVSVGRIAVAHRLDVRVDAEDLLDDDEAPSRRARRRGAVGGEAVAVFGR